MVLKLSFLLHKFRKVQTKKPYFFVSSLGFASSRSYEVKLANTRHMCNTREGATRTNERQKGRHHEAGNTQLYHTGWMPRGIALLQVSHFFNIAPQRFTPLTKSLKIELLNKPHFLAFNCLFLVSRPLTSPTKGTDRKDIPQTACRDAKEDLSLTTGLITLSLGSPTMTLPRHK